MTGTGDTYECAHCHRTFSKGWSDEEALAEYDELWQSPREDLAVVCDECFTMISAWIDEQAADLD